MMGSSRMAAQVVAQLRTDLEREREREMLAEIIEAEKEDILPLRIWINSVVARHGSSYSYISFSFLPADPRKVLEIHNVLLNPIKNLQLSLHCRNLSVYITPIS
jgi:hypothetical protein